MLKLARCFCQDEGIVLDEKVYHSEMSNVARNRAIAYLLESKGVIGGKERYFITILLMIEDIDAAIISRVLDVDQER